MAGGESGICAGCPGAGEDDDGDGECELARGNDDEWGFEDEDWGWCEEILFNGGGGEDMVYSAPPPWGFLAKGSFNVRI